MVGSLPLVSMDHSVDLTLGLQQDTSAKSVALRGEGSGFSVLLRRGHTYKIDFQAAVSGFITAVALPGVVVNATWTDLRVSLAEDDTELLLEHNDSVLSAIADHDQVIGEQIAVHDAEIKHMLKEIRRGQKKIIALMLLLHGKHDDTKGSPRN